MIDINILAERPRLHQHGRAGPVQRAVGGRHAEGPLQQDILLLRVARREDSGKNKFLRSFLTWCCLLLSHCDLKNTS